MFEIAVALDFESIAVVGDFTFDASVGNEDRGPVIAIADFPFAVARNFALVCTGEGDIEQEFAEIFLVCSKEDAVTFSGKTFHDVFILDGDFVLVFVLLDTFQWILASNVGFFAFKIKE